MSIYNFFIFRSSRSGVFCKKGALRNFPKFTGKHLFQSLYKLYYSTLLSINTTTTFAMLGNLLVKTISHYEIFMMNFCQYLKDALWKVCNLLKQKKLLSPVSQSCWNLFFQNSQAICYWVDLITVFQRQDLFQKISYHLNPLSEV